MPATTANAAGDRPRSCCSGPGSPPTASRTASALLHDPHVLDAFRIANRVMADAARRRFGVMQGKDPAAVEPRPGGRSSLRSS